MRTSTPTRPADQRAGFSLIEILVVLAIFALSTAVVMPGMSRMLDQATAHAVFFEFQRQVSDLRREVSRTGIPVRLVDPAAEEPLPDGDHVVTLRSPWRYTMAPALTIGEGGVCGNTSVNLVTDDRVVMTLKAEGGGCQFIRQQIKAAPPRESSSQK